MSETPRWIVDGLPRLNTRRVLSRPQALAAVLLLAGLVVALLADARVTFLWLNVLCIALYLVFSHYKLALQFLCLGQRPEAELPDDDAAFPWPRYSILVPLYHEGSAAPGLIEHLAAMDYPPEKLQILLLVEEDDAETRQAIDSCDIEAPFRMVIVPVSEPRTKPKACNYGLMQADGELLVIYDAEDRPDTDQLKKAAFQFYKSPPDLVCLQARLDFYNRTRNMITRLFTAEYACWFDFYLPGLHALEAPIPLGGTSNHFRLPALRLLKGWDPFNVTEDCDLGVRLYVEGQRTAPLDSTTLEEATFRLGPWIRQRSRWFKGYLQTYLVHLRQQPALLRSGGLGSMLHFHMVFGANCFCLLMNPVYWLLTVLWFTTRNEYLSSFYPLWVLIPALIAFLAGNAAFVLSAMLACLHRKNYSLIPVCLLIPVYWVFMSLGAWKGALQLITRPFYWEKTPHEGVTAGEAGS